MAVGKSDFCPSCGRPQSTGRCPHCLTEQISSSETAAADPFIASHSGAVIESLAATIGPIPRILLSDTGNGTVEPPLVNPASPEMPALADRGVRVQLLGEIARGGMGVVFKGRDPDLGRDLAVKVLLETHRENPDLVRRFVEEAQIGGQLQHPGVVPIYELGTFGEGRPYFTMKLVKGQTLGELLAERKSPADDLPRFLNIFHQVCQTMAYAHARDVIHRDLKPSNVMVGSFGEVQVMDWGLAKVLPRGGVVDDAGPRPAPAHQTVIAARIGTDSDLSQAGSVMGTPAYMAPEQARGEIDSVDERADVFALGSILCEILTGRPAFVGRTAGELHRKAALGDLADAIARLEESPVDSELAELACDCLAREADDRPRDAGLVAQRMTTYRAQVENKLRAAEIACATEEARAEEEAKRRVLSDELAREAQARAEESRRTAETAQAKAKAETRARRMTGALAVALLVLVLAIGGGYAVFQRQRALRHAQVDLALRDAEVLRGEAERSAGDPARWRAAREATHAVERLLGDARDQTTRQRVSALVQSVTAAARAAEHDQKLLDKLFDIRSAQEDDPDWSLTDAAYANAFREAELDVADLPQDEIGARIKARPASVALTLAAALDDWARVRREKRHDRKGAERLAQAARSADPDPWRNRLRDALDAAEGQKRLNTLRELAGSAQADDLPAVSLDLLGMALREAGDPQRAEAVLRRAQRRHPGDVWLNYNLAECLVKLARRSEAIRYYTAARAIQPEVAHELAHALESSGEPDEAIAVFQELTRIRPGNGRHLRCLGGSLRKRGRELEANTAIDAAIATLREEIRQRPQDSRTARNLGRALSERGKHEEAIAELRTALRIKPDDANLRVALGLSLRSSGKNDAAIEEFREAIRLKHDLADAHAFLGEALAYDKNDYVAAEAELREAIRLGPGDHAEYESLGDILSRHGKYNEAITELRIAARIDPTCFIVRRHLGDALRSQGKLEDAVAEYRETLRLRPDDNALYYYGKCLEDLGKSEMLIAEYREMIRLRPDWNFLLNGLAWILVRAGDRPARDYDEALVLARKCVALNPKDGELVNTLALAEYRVRHWNEAIAAAKRSIELRNGGSAFDWFLLAMANAQNHEKVEARTWFDKAVAHTKEKDPNNAELLQIWKEAAGLLGEPGPKTPEPVPPPTPAAKKPN
jgi:eukaryotic-like serine/threonine-protein kinase